MYVVYTKHLKPSRTNIICSFRPTFILRLLFKEPQPAATSRRVHFPLPHSLPPSHSLSYSVSLSLSAFPLPFTFHFLFFFCLPMNIIVKVNEFFFQSPSAAPVPAPPPLPLPLPFPLRQHHTAASVASSVWATIFFLWRRRLSYGSFAALSSMLLNFNYCYIFHTLRVLNATCCKLHAACCVVLRRRGDDKHVKCQMGNGKLWKCQMPNAKWEMEQKPFWLAKS